jgi:transcriptional regulator with XRE-family HTH domain
MVLQKRVGTLLRETREEKKKTIREVSQDTNITPRHIEALENEDYAIFPGETYAIGFLRSYAEYLNLDADQVIGLYRGLQIDQSKTPVRELTRQPGILVSLQFMDRRNLLYIAGAAAILILSIALYSYSGLGKSGRPSPAVNLCEGRQLVNINTPVSGAVPKQENLSLDNTLRFVVDTASVKICLKSIRRDGGQNARAEMIVSVNDDQVYNFSAAEGEAVRLHDISAELANLNTKILLTPGVLGDFSARVQLESVAAETPSALNEPNGPVPSVTAGDIQVSLRFNADSYFEWDNDGLHHTGMIVEAGKVKTVEAKNRLEIKVGNGGGVQILKEGRLPRVVGPPGKLVKIIYKKVPDPLDPGLFNIQESIEVVQ